MADKLPPLKVSDLLAQIKAVLRESRMTVVEKCSDIRSIVAIAEAALATPRDEDECEEALQRVRELCDDYECDEPCDGFVPIDEIRAAIERPK